MNSVALRARGMTKRFGANLACSNVDLEIRSGRIHALLGENGAGKSTLISMISGQYRADEGRIAVDGEKVAFRSPKDALQAGIGVVHQDFRLVPPFTVLENVVLGSRDAPGAASQRRCTTILDQLGFELDLTSRVADLAVGQQQQTEILKLLYRGLDILILDEPTAVLTPQQAEQLFASLRRFIEQDKAVLFVSHRLHEVARFADHLTVLRQGRRVADQPVGVMDRHHLAELMIGETQPEPAERGPAGHGAVALELKDVKVAGSERDRLDGLSLAVHCGEVVGVAGVSGNGQRQLAEVAVGLQPVEDGVRRCVSESVAFIPEDRLASGLVGRMSVAQNLALRQVTGSSRGRWHVSAKEMKQRAIPLIERFNIPVDNPSVTVGSLSGGGQQRVVIARELADDPRVLVASQPTRGLDVASAQAVRDRLLEVRNGGGAVLVISEDLDEIFAVSDRIVVLSHGRALANLSREDATAQAVGALMTGADDTAFAGESP